MMGSGIPKGPGTKLSKRGVKPGQDFTQRFGKARYVDCVHTNKGHERHRKSTKS